MNKEIHQIQAQILKKLLLSEGARFAQIKPDGIPSDQFTFHIKRLLENGIITKEGDLYHLTLAGKEYANRFDIDSGPVKTEKQAKLGVLVIAFRDTNGVREYVAQERLKHPFFGYRGFISGKIKWGERVVDTAERELKEETGLTAKVKHHSIYHEHIYATSGELLEDKYFFICTAANPSGVLLKEFEGGRNEWITEKEFLKGNVFYDIPELVAHIRANGPLFSEKSYTVEKY